MPRHTTNLRNIGGSVMLAVPPAFLDLLNLGAGAKVGTRVEDARLVVERTTRPRYTLEELLAQCDDAAAPPPRIAHGSMRARSATNSCSEARRNLAGQP